VIFDAAFASILGGQLEIGLALFDAIFDEADVMRVRLAGDLVDRDPTTKIVFALEPIVGLIELSGYARLMEELDGTGIWQSVRSRWDSLLGYEEGPRIAQWFLEAQDAVDSVWSLTPGGLARSTRQQQLSDLLRDRGMGQSDSFGVPSSSEQADRSPLLAVFAPSRYGLSEKLGDLFVVEYLAERLPEGIELPQGARALVERIRRRRERGSRAGGDTG
jgi:hypothetical protein